ncbi:DNA ligase D [Roseivivax sp. CAU 1761]
MDRLKDYNAKRDFSRTREPEGRAADRKTGAPRWFSVQKHAASSLHYDLRLEHDGVLLSWAVPKGPSPRTGDKRLAQRTEDHPFDYGDFEGTIPKGEYGGGTVMLWDRGTWYPRGDVDEMLARGNLKMEIDGERMQGGWALVRFKKGGEGAWLLVKEDDDHARDSSDALTGPNLTSVSSGREMEEIAADAPARGGRSAPAAPERTRAAPRFRKPQLATLVEEAPEGDDWVHETKFDGYRALAAVGKGGTRLWTRGGKDWTDKFAGLARAFDGLACDAALIDGEVMAARIKGSPFSSLQRALKEGGRLVFYAFDLLHLDGEDLTRLPQEERRARLETLMKDADGTGALRLADQMRGHGAEIFAAACAAGAEGIISKRIDAPYRGSRSRAWQKVKCTRRQEFVVGGYAPSDKKRAFSSLLLGDYGPEGLRYRGRVGTGFSERDLEDIAGALRTRKTAPFVDVPDDMARDAVWVTPDMVVEVDFTEFTDDGRIRHGAYQGRRDDKDPKSVRLELPDDSPDPMAEAQDAQSGGGKTRSGKPGARDDGGAEPRVAGVRISSPQRAVFPEAGCTKLDVARHYERVGERLTEIAGRRPLSLLRAPSGITGDVFFQKHAGKGFPDALSTVAIEESDGGTADYMYATRPESFVAAAQMGTLEFHVWGCRIDRLDRPDRLVFDLDPDEGLGWPETRGAALDLRDRLSDLGLAAGAMVTGGKGVHVWLPLHRSHDWDLVKAFAKTLAHVLAEAEPDRYLATMAKKKRKGRIFIDWLRNERGATAVAPYSLRARPGGPVAMPVAWDELRDLDAPNGFDMGTVRERLEEPCPYLALAEDPQRITAEVVEKLERWRDA